MEAYKFRIVAVDYLSGSPKIVLIGDAYENGQEALKVLSDIVEERCIELQETELGDFQAMTGLRPNPQGWAALIYDLAHEEYGRVEDVIRYFIVRESAGPEKTAEWLADTPFSCLCSACGHAKCGTPNDDDAICPSCGAAMQPHEAYVPVPMWTIVWKSDQGKNWECLPLLAAIELVDNLGAYGVEELYIFPPSADITVGELEDNKRGQC